MSTLKKILALTLALAMVMSLGVFAAFKDQATIDEDCTSAMELMNALGVILGDNNGNANPTKNITRAEAATMIFRLMNKGKDDASIYNGMKIFTDVPSGVWFEGYVNYCYTMGIVQGRTATTFDPYAPVTGMEIAKMLLTCCGYNAEKQGYTGANWAANVQNDAFTAGMLEDYGMALSVPAQRQWVAVMFSDALNCTMVKYYLGDLADAGTTLGEKKFDYKTATGTLVAIGTTAVAKTDSTLISGTAKYTTVRVSGTDYTFKMLANANLLGQKVRVYYKAGTDDDATQFDTVYSIVATGTSKVGTALLNAVKNPSGDKYTVGDVSATVDDDNTVVVYPNSDCKYALAGTFDNYYGQNSVAPVRAVDTDADGVFDYIMIDFSQYGSIAISSKGAVTFTNTAGHAYAPIAADDVADYINYVNTVENGDFVKLTANVFTGLYDVEALSPMNATVTRIYTAGEKYALDGTAYYISDDATVSTTNLAALGNDVTVYVDGACIVKAGAVDTTVNALPENLGLVLYKAETTELGSTSGYKVVLMTQDGKIATYVVATDSTSQTIAAALSAQDSSEVDKMYDADGLHVDVVKYTVNTDGTLKLAWPPSTGDIKSVTKVDYTNSTFNYKNDTLSAGGNTYRVASDANIFVAYLKSASSTSFTFTVMKASDFTADQSALAGFYFTKVNGLNTILGGAMLLTNTSGENEFALNKGSATVTGTYVYATSNDYDLYDKTDDETYRYVDVVDQSGKALTLRLAADADAVAGAVYTYTTTDGISTLSTDGFTKDTAVLKGLSGNVVMLGSTIKTLSDDVKVLVYNDDDELVAGEIADLYVDSDDAADQNGVVYVVDNDSSSSTYQQVIFVIGPVDIA